MKKLIIALFMAITLTFSGCSSTDPKSIDKELVAEIVELIEDYREKKEEERDTEKPETPETPEPPPVVEPEPPKEDPIVTTPNVVPKGSIALKYYKRTNGDRFTYYTYRGPLMKVGDVLRVTVGSHSKVYTAKKRSNGSIGADDSGGFVLKNSDVSGRGISVLMPAGYKGPYRPAYITFIKR